MATGTKDSPPNMPDNICASLSFWYSMKRPAARRIRSRMLQESCKSCVQFSTRRCIKFNKQRNSNLQQRPASVGDLLRFEKFLPPLLLSHQLSINEIVQYFVDSTTTASPSTCYYRISIGVGASKRIENQAVIPRRGCTLHSLRKA